MSIKLIDDLDTFSKLLTSVKTANTNYIRTLSPFQVSELLQRLVDEEGFEMAVEILPIQKDMINEFLRLKKLPEECQNAIFWNDGGGLGVGFTTAAKIAELDSQEDMTFLFNSALEKSLGKTDVRKINSDSKENKKTIQESYERILNSKPQVNRSYIVVMELNLESYNKLQNELKDMHKGMGELLAEKIKNKFQIEIIGITIKKERVALTLNQENYKKFKNKIPSDLSFSEFSTFMVN